MSEFDDMDALDRAVVIALGSNLAGNHPTRQSLLDAALAGLRDLGISVRSQSSWWSSAAWPDSAAPGYLNGIALVETDLAPRELLSALIAHEHGFGRTRGEANAPRTLDLDLIAHGRLVIRASDLVVPHPRAHERRFVMGPLAEIAPLWRHPVSGRTAADLAAAAPVGQDARPVRQAHAALHNRPRNAI